jgi:hypothetical protein
MQTRRAIGTSVALAWAGVVLFLGPFPAAAQGRGGAPAAPQSPKVQAPIDLTGYWVSIVTEDWRYRMVTPPKGDYASVPINPAGRRIADAWDPAKDEASGDACKAYGAAAVMRIPGRLHIAWDGETALKVETDAGTQTRMLQFGPRAAAGPPTLQGESVASWDGLPPPGRGGVAQTPRGSLKVVTTNLKSGYLRRNGVPYSDKAVVTEFYDLVTEPNGVQWLILQTTVEDPTYLTQPFITSTHFRKQADGSGWSPSPCNAQ